MESSSPRCIIMWWQESRPMPCRCSQKVRTPSDLVDPWWWWEELQLASPSQQMRHVVTAQRNPPPPSFLDNQTNQQVPTIVVPQKGCGAEGAVGFFFGSTDPRPAYGLGGLGPGLRQRVTSCGIINLPADSPFSPAVYPAVGVAEPGPTRHIRRFWRLGHHPPVFEPRILVRSPFLVGMGTTVPVFACVAVPGATTLGSRLMTFPFQWLISSTSSWVDFVQAPTQLLPQRLTPAATIEDKKCVLVGPARQVRETSLDSRQGRGGGLCLESHRPQIGTTCFSHALMRCRAGFDPHGLIGDARPGGRIPSYKTVFVRMINRTSLPRGRGLRHLPGHMFWW